MLLKVQHSSDDDPVLDWLQSLHVDEHGLVHRLLITIVVSRPFSVVIMACILFNCILLAMHNPKKDYLPWEQAMEFLFIAVFNAEWVSPALFCLPLLYTHTHTQTQPHTHTHTPRPS